MKILNILFLSLLFMGLHACKSDSNRSLLSNAKKKQGSSPVSKVIGKATEPFRTLSADMMLRSEEVSTDDIKLNVAISQISGKSIELNLSHADNRNLLISTIIPRYFAKSEIETSSGDTTWFVYRKEKIRDFHDKSKTHSVTVLILSDYSAFTVRLNTGDQTRVRTVQGTALVLEQ